MWNRYFGLLAMAALLRADYELTGPREAEAQSAGSNPLVSTSLTPQQKEWAERAVRRYREAQEKKWRRWREAMFEAK